MASVVANVVENLREGLEAFTGISLPERAPVARDLLSKILPRDIERTEATNLRSRAYETDSVAYRVQFTPELRSRLDQEGIYIAADQTAMVFEMKYGRPSNGLIMAPAQYKVSVEYSDGEKAEIPLLTTKQSSRAFNAVESIHNQRKAA